MDCCDSLADNVWSIIISVSVVDLRGQVTVRKKFDKERGAYRIPGEGEVEVGRVES